MILTDKLLGIISNIGKKYSQSNSQGKRNPWVIAWFGIIGLFLSANAIFIIFAITSNPGLVTEDYYEQGRLYERNAIKRLSEQNRLRWESKLEIPETINLNMPGTYRFSAVDSRGIPISDADVQIVAYRPSDATADFKIELQSIGPGLYQGSMAFPLPGVWDLNVKIRRGADQQEMVQRLSVK